MFIKFFCPPVPDAFRQVTVMSMKVSLSLSLLLITLSCDEA